MSSWRRNVWIVGLASLVTMVGMYAFVPFFPDVLRGMGIHDDATVKIWSGVLVAAAPLAACVMGPVWGALGDLSGRNKAMMVRSLAAIAVFVGAMGWACWPGAGGGPWILLWLRLGQGAFSGFIAPALTLATAAAPEEEHRRITTLCQTALVIGGLLGPSIGGVLASRMGAHWGFLFCGATALVSTLLVVFLAEESEGPSEAGAPSSGGIGRGLRRAWEDARANFAIEGMMALMIGIFLFQTAATLIQPVMRLHVERFHEIPAVRMAECAGWAFTAVAAGQILFAWLWVRWMDQVGTARSLPLTAVLTALAYAPQGLMTAARPFLGLRFLQGAVGAATVPAAYAHVARLAPVSRRGGAYGLALSSFQFANVVGPLAGGVLSARFGTGPLFLVSAILLAAASLWMRGNL